MATHTGLLPSLPTTSIGEKGQLTVPKQFREDLGLGMGAPFAVLRLGDGLILLPEQKRFEHFCEQVSSALTLAGISREALLETLPQARNDIYKRRYGSVTSKNAARKSTRSRRGK